MSEGADSSAKDSGTEGKSSAKSSKTTRNPWKMIAAIVVAALLVLVVLYVVMKPKGHELTVDLTSPATVGAGKTVLMNVTITLDKNSSKEVKLAEKDVTIRWSKSPATLGDFDLLFKEKVNFTGAKFATSGTVTCKVTYKDASGKEITGSASKDIVVNAPYLETVAVTPSSKEIFLGSDWTFNATALNSVGDPMTGATFAWEVGGLPSASYTLNSTTGSKVKFTGNAVGNGTLNVTATIGTLHAHGNATVSISGSQYPRTVDHRWYDFFNVPFGQWWDKRWAVYSAEKPWSRTYPYIFEYHGSPPGNIIYYANLRLNTTARNITEVNMNERPEFLPFFSSTERGGNADLRWYMQYLTQAEVQARVPSTASWNDGWFINWKGTTTLDQQAAKAVLGITDADFADFANWWAVNNGSTTTSYQDWITLQSSGELDIHPAYDGDMNWIDFTFWCEKVGNSIVIHYDTISWGMDMMMSRWMWDTFMPTEWYYEDFYFNAHIGPERADADIDGAVAYGLLAAESIYTYPGRTRGDPVWFWQAMMQDYMFSEPPTHPHSLYDKYAGGPTSPTSIKNYKATYPGNLFYGGPMTYDIVPGSWNLSAGETMSFEWPSGDQLFILQKFNLTSGLPVIGKTENMTAPMTMDYAEPNATDFPSNVLMGDNNMTFIGPINMWDWSRNQTSHTNLTQEWERVGLLPRGVPYIEWKNESAFVPHLDHFEVSGIPSPITGGTSSDVTVRAFDQSNSVFTGYRGTVHFTSNDSAAILPPNYQFTAGDNGVHTFTGGVTLNTAGTHSVTVADTVVTTATGSQTGIVVQIARHAAEFVISGMPGTITEGDLVSATVTVRDQYGDVFTAYRGTVNFTSNRSDVVLPANYQFTAGDAGVHVFASELNFTGLGYYTLNVGDIVSAPPPPGAVDLGTAGDFVILGETGISTTGTTSIVGDIGISPAAASFITGFGLTMDASNEFSTSAVVNGRVYAADYTPPTPAKMTTAIGDMQTAYTDAAGRTNPDYTELGAGDITSMTLAPGLYKWSTGLLISAAGVTLSGSASDVWIFQIAQDLTVANGAHVTLSGGAVAANVFWQVAGQTSIGTTAVMKGTILCMTLISMGTGATLEGRALAQTAVTLDSNAVTSPSGVPSVIGSKTDIFVVGSEPVITRFLIFAPLQIDEQIAGDLTVVALDQYDRLFDTYNGTVHFSTNATLGDYTLPADYTFVPGDMGNKTFTGGMRFNVPGWFEVSVGDVINVTAVGSLGIQVMPRAPEIHYKLYDIFEEPFGQWWWGNSATYKGRLIKYETDAILWNETHKHAILYHPNTTAGNEHAVIMAPYRWTTDARNLTSLTVSNPYLMPSRYVDPWGLPAPITAGASVNIDLYMQYVDEAVWNAYWKPVLIGYGNPAALVNPYLKNQGDGYVNGVIYSITMNREAALQWLNLSLAVSDAEIPSWWVNNSLNYEFFWRAWIDDQANNMSNYDIWCGYEDVLWDTFFAQDLTVNPVTGEVTLTISYVNWGYEVLMTRWLTAAGVCNHEVYWEDFTLNASMNTQYSDVRFDAVGTYNLHAVKANASMGTDGAWAWDPSGIDYAPSWAAPVMGHPSEFNPYANVTYQSWNSGDTVGFYGNEVNYDSTPHRLFSLTSDMTLTVELPKGSDVPCFRAESVPAGSVARARLGNNSNYVPLMYNGTASLGFTTPDVSSMYNPSTQTLTIVGPMSFDNPRGGGLLYHGAPWIEFNVTSGVKALSTPEITEPTSTGSPGASAGSVTSELVSLAAVACGVLLTVAAIGAVRRVH